MLSTSQHVCSVTLANKPSLLGFSAARQVSERVLNDLSHLEIPIRAQAHVMGEASSNAEFVLVVQRFHSQATHVWRHAIVVLHKWPYGHHPGLGVLATLELHPIIGALHGVVQGTRDG